MRKLDIGTSNYTEVVVLDGPGAGGACHQYQVNSVSVPDVAYAIVQFQKGGVKEAGVNGCFQEDLLAIVIDRLRSFQAGDFACRENAIALTKCEEALMWLQSRTAKRVARGVEGTSTK